MSMILVASQNTAEEEMLLADIAREAQEEEAEARRRGMTVQELKDLLEDLCLDVDLFLPPSSDDELALRTMLNLPQGSLTS